VKMIGGVTGRASWRRAFRRLRANYISSAGRGHSVPDTGSASPGVQDSSGNVLPDGIHQRQGIRTCFHYSVEEMDAFGTSVGWKPTYIGDWNHPRNQVMKFFEATHVPSL
jgi:hypothetical protein